MQTMNAYDYDFGTGGEVLLTDPTGVQRLVITDKGGYGHLLTPGQLCGSSYPDAPCVGFASGDPGSLMTFGAAAYPCSGAAADNCDRISSMALFDNEGKTNRVVYLVYWPYTERLTAMQLWDPKSARRAGPSEPESGLNERVSARHERE
jgi:hypothetical protein